MTKIHETSDESKVRYPEPRMAIRPEADSGDGDEDAVRGAYADIHNKTGWRVYLDGARPFAFVDLAEDVLGPFEGYRP